MSGYVYAVGPVTSNAIERSGSITSGGNAQDFLTATDSRKGFDFQNQSTADMYVRDKGPAGSNVATAGGDSVWVPAGSYYEPPQVSNNGYSIFCATTGAKFFAKEW